MVIKIVHKTLGNSSRTSVENLKKFNCSLVNGFTAIVLQKNLDYITTLLVDKTLQNNKNVKGRVIEVAEKVSKLDALFSMMLDNQG